MKQKENDTWLLICFKNKSKKSVCIQPLVELLISVY